MREARLIVMVLGTMPSMRWALQTIVAEGALAKLILLMPPSDAAGRVERWQLAAECLAGTPWHPGMTTTDPRRLVAAYLADGGRVVMTGGGRSERDYDLAVRIGTGMVVGAMGRAG